jgi:hypothetical protein
MLGLQSIQHNGASFITGSEVKNEDILHWKTKGTLPIVAKEA